MNEQHLQRGTVAPPSIVAKPSSSSKTTSRQLSKSNFGNPDVGLTTRVLTALGKFSMRDIDESCHARLTQFYLNS